MSVHTRGSFVVQVVEDPRVPPVHRESKEADQKPDALRTRFPRRLRGCAERSISSRVQLSNRSAHAVSAEELREQMGAGVVRRQNEDDLAHLDISESDARARYHGSSRRPLMYSRARRAHIVLRVDLLEAGRDPLTPLAGYARLVEGPHRLPRNRVDQFPTFVLLDQRYRWCRISCRAPDRRSWPTWTPMDQPVRTEHRLSVGVRLDRPPLVLADLSLAVGSATVDAIDGGCGARLELEWPDDVLFESRELGGGLVDVVESSVASDNRCRASD